MSAAPSHTQSVIPAKAGIHAAGFMVVSKIAVSMPRASTSKAPAEWVPAFAGMTARLDDIRRRYLDVRHPIARCQNSRAP